MAKKKTKIAVTYLVTIVLSLILIGGAGYFGLNAYLNSDNSNQMKPVDGIVTTAPEDYEPSIADSRTIFLAYEPEKKMSSACFIVVRFIPSENKTVIVPLQSDICTEVDGKTNTLYEFYRLGGVTDGVKAAESALKIKIDKYVKLGTESFTILTNYMGNIRYDVPYNLIYEDPQTKESIIIKKGEQILDAMTLKKVLTFPNYNGGEEYRSRVLGTISTELLNSGAKGILLDGMDAVFNDVVNSDAETNITRYDFDESKRAIKFMLENNNNPAQLVLPSGVYNENNCYVLDESFISTVPSWFGMDS